MKKLQVFISSTYDDLREERQAVIESVLKEKHIPAGMEYFTGENVDQLEVIYDWIDDSDIFVLLVGNRYGSIRGESGKSYTEMEFDYAKLKGKPIILCVMSDKLIAKRSLRCSYTDDRVSYERFRKQILYDSGNRSIFESPHQLKEIIGSTLRSMVDNPKYSFIGWAKGNAVSQLVHVDTSKELGVQDYLYACRSLPVCFDNAKILKFIFTSGKGFFNNYLESIKSSLNEGAVVKIIHASPESEFVDEVEEMENYLISKGVFLPHSINDEIDIVERTFRDMRRNVSSGEIFIGSFNTQFRGNMVIIGDDVAFFTPVLPPNEASRTLTIKLGKGRVFDDCNLYFDTLFEILETKRRIRKL